MSKSRVTEPSAGATSQLVTAHPLIEKSSLLIHAQIKQLKSNHRLSSHSCVSPGTLRQSTPFQTTCKIHLPGLSLIRHSSDWKSLLSKIKCLSLFLATLHKKGCGTQGHTPCTAVFHLETVTSQHLFITY